MSEQATGRITFANGAPAVGVRVRIFDRDPGAHDDDLTLAEGVTDANGDYSATYDPSRAADKFDITTTEPRSWNDWTLVQRTRTFTDPLDYYMPYVRCSYTLYGRERIVTFDLEPSPQAIRLPDPPPVERNFVPSVHGFHFINSFHGIPLPFTIPALPLLDTIGGAYGLCGGMSAAAADYFYAGRATPELRDVPEQGTTLYSYLYRRQLDSFSPFGEPVMRFMKWMRMNEDGPLGTWERSYSQFEQLKALFDAGLPLQPIGLVFAAAQEPLWENHQVLAYGYTERSPSAIDIKIYDPNYPENDQVVIRAETMALRGSSSSGGTKRAAALRCRRVAIVADTLGRAVEDVRPARGIFLMPYEMVMPPAE